jgi:mono/diheme cytochrome c family protein
MRHTVADGIPNQGVHTPRSPWLCVAALCLLAAGCRQEMATQPRYNPLQESRFFPDGRSARPLVEGTVARGPLRDDDPLLYEGVEAGPAPSRAAAALVALGGNPLNASALAALGIGEATAFPFPTTDEVMATGRVKFNVYCSVCHDRTGSGHGKIVERSYLRPPSYHTDRLRQAPVGHFFRVITDGYGGMPDYREQIPPRDRWCIIAYIRALQFSQNAPLADLTDEQRKALAEKKEPQ